MTDITPVKGQCVFSRQVGPRLLEVYEDEALGYVGYANGEREVSAARPDLVITGLSKKFGDDIPTGDVVSLDAFRQNSQQD